MNGTLPYAVNIESDADVIMLGKSLIRGEWNRTSVHLDNHLIVFVIGGSGSFTFGGETYHLAPGDVLFLPGMTPYTSETDDFCEFYYFHFKISTPITEIGKEEVSQYIRYSSRSLIDIAFMPEHKTEHIVIPTLTKGTGATGELLSTVERAIYERRRMGLLTDVLIRCLFRYFMVQLSELYFDTVAENETENSIPPLIRRAFLLMRTNETERSAIKDVAAELGVSIQYLDKSFRKFTGLSPVMYLNELRLARARLLLRNSTMSVKEIAYQTGFENPEYFCRLFKKHTGMTAGMYRQYGGSPTSKPYSWQ